MADASGRIQSAIRSFMDDVVTGGGKHISVACVVQFSRLLLSKKPTADGACLKEMSADSHLGKGQKPILCKKVSAAIWIHRIKRSIGII